jgi:hypothetical protein
VVSISARALVRVAAVSEVPARVPEFLHHRPVREISVVRAALASDQNNRTYHRPYRAAD